MKGEKTRRKSDEWKRERKKKRKAEIKTRDEEFPSWLTINESN